MNGLELAALYTLQDRLARNAEGDHRLIHSHVALGRRFDESSDQFIGEADAPGSTCGKLFAWSNALMQPPMNR